MKTFAGFIAGFITALALRCGRGRYYHHDHDGEDTRIVHCFGKYLNLGRDATQAEVKAAISTFVKGVVFNVEAEEAKATATQGVTQINPT
jgi:hypothetical protein